VAIDRRCSMVKWEWWLIYPLISDIIYHYYNKNEKLLAVLEQTTIKLSGSE
jgi:hypothetical protein